MAALVFVFNFDPDPSSSEESVPTVPQPSTTTVTTTLEPSTTVVPAVQTLDELAAGYEGTLVAVVNGNRLIMLRSDGERLSTTIPTTSRVSVDSAGRHLAFLAAPRGTLYMGSLGTWSSQRVGVSSYQWHQSAPGRIAWVEGEDRLCAGEVSFVYELQIEGCAAIAGAALTNITLIGFDDEGFVVSTIGPFIRGQPPSSEIHRLDLEGNLVATLPGEESFVAPSGQVLVWESHPFPRGRVFTITDPDLGNARQLDWSPPVGAAEYGMVAVSPANPDEIALVTSGEPGSSRLEIWDVARGELLESVIAAGQATGVAWDSTGRYVLVWAVATEYIPDQHFLTVVDRLGGFGYHRFDGPISDVHLVAELTCEEAPSASCPGASDESFAFYNERHGYSVEVPSGWEVAPSPLIVQASPADILSMGTFPLRGGGDRCVHVPVASLEALGTTDGFVSVIGGFPENGSYVPRIARPEDFAELLDGVDDGDAYQCMSPVQRLDLGVLRWVQFSDQGRGFLLLVAIGREASEATFAEVAAVLNTIVFEPR